MHAYNIAKFIDELIEHEETFDFHFLEWVRCAFTTMCLMEKIDSDTKICDELITELYNSMDDRSCSHCVFEINDFDELTLEKFYNYMVKYIV